MLQKQIRNFAIIAHIDHGKSTLADRFLEATKAVKKRDMKNQFLDKMDLERERGITIKSQAVKLNYINKKGESFIYNLIDTPGHTDFNYEVYRSLSVCEGVLLLVDATQGIEAQTIENYNIALRNKLTIIPVINKIDLKNSNIEQTKKDITEITNIDPKDILAISAKNGIGIEHLLEKIAKIIPPPIGSKSHLKAFIFDSWFNVFRGIILLVRVFNGIIKIGDTITLAHNGKSFIVQEIGAHTPYEISLKKLAIGDVGFIVTNIKDTKDIKAGSVITNDEKIINQFTDKIKEATPIVFAGLFPTDHFEFKKLKKALMQLSLNDPSIVYDLEKSNTLGFGFRCGFLGLLHMEITKNRIEREFQIDTITTAPTVTYKVYLKTNKKIQIKNPHNMPKEHLIKTIEELFVKTVIYSPKQYLGILIQFCQNKKGNQQAIEYLSKKYVKIEYIFPMSTIVTDFSDNIKTISQGYASFKYVKYQYKKVNITKVDILINKNIIDALSFIACSDTIYKKGKSMCQKIKKMVPRQLYKITIQAIASGKIIAKESIPPLRKNVTAKCSGGDITRKKKLLEKQKKGKKRMEKIGNINISKSIFFSIIKNN